LPHGSFDRDRDNRIHFRAAVFRCSTQDTTLLAPSYASITAGRQLRFSNTSNGVFFADAPSDDRNVEQVAEQREFKPYRIRRDRTVDITRDGLETYVTVVCDIDRDYVGERPLADERAKDGRDPVFLALTIVVIRLWSSSRWSASI
jgi:hypothetical protein